MEKLLRSIHSTFLSFGFDFRKTVYSFRGLPFYLRSLSEIKKHKKYSKELFKFGTLYPCLADRFVESGTARGHYFHQDLLVARKIYLNNPKLHLDIGSRIDGFVAHVASYRSIEVIDIRPLLSNIPNIKFIQADLMNDIDESLMEYCDSISSLHAIEHFGLGRYGDDINFDGYLLGLNNIYNILKKNGKFYFSVPIGPQRIEFNAHRVFSIDYLLELFYGKYNIDNFSYVDDKGDLHENVMLDNRTQPNYGCYYGCGIFEMTKL